MAITPRQKSNRHNGSEIFNINTLFVNTSHLENRKTNDSFTLNTHSNWLGSDNHFWFV